MENITSLGGIEQNFETQYARSLENILENGVRCENRTGTDTLMIQHQYFFIENVLANFPIIKGKKVFPKLALKELMWMMNGRSDVKWLQDRGVTYWNEWANTDILSQIPLGSIGKSYGHQMRNFNGTDQLEDLLKLLISNPMSRRLKISLWNPADLTQTTLPPCVDYYNFGCTPHEKFDNAFYVDLHVHARSEDSFLGQPYDFMSVAWKLQIICHLASKFSNKIFKARNIHYTADNYHMYVNHEEQVLTYLKNVEENKNNVINKQAIAQIGNNVYDDLNKFLLVSDNEKYKNFWISKYYDDEYDTIEAPIAV